MEDMEPLNSVSIKQEPDEKPHKYNTMYSIPLKSVQSVSVKQEPIVESNEYNVSYSIPKELVTPMKQEHIATTEHYLKFSITVEHVESVVKQEPEEKDSVKEVDAESHNYDKSYTISVESVKSENVLQESEKVSLQYNMNSLQTVEPESVEQETLVGPFPHNVSHNLGQLSTLKQHLNMHSGIKTKECKTHDSQKKRLKQCIERISTLDQHIVENPNEYNTCENKATVIKKRIRPPGEKKYECDTCDFKAARPSQLESHKRTHTGEKPHQCNMCDFKSARSSTLKTHIITHTGEKPYKCDICDFKTAHAIDLKRHIKTHTGEKPHKCDVCDYRTIRLNSLKRHIRTHTGEKPYECDMCDYKSPNDNGLRQHKRIHTGEKPYKCNVCDYKSAQSSALKKHMRKHSKE